MRIAVTADLHWGHGPRGDGATLQLAEHLQANPPDLMLLGGDLGTQDHFAACLKLFQDLPCPKLVIPGNHDLWVEETDPRGDSLTVYQEHLPALCQAHGCHYLDHEPFILPDIGLAVVGSINWYDYSWAIERMRQEVPDWEERLRRKAFTRGRHNDGRFIRWPLDDVRFTAQVVAAFEDHLRTALKQVAHAIVLTHHPATYSLSYPRVEPPRGWDSLLWDALAGNTAMEHALNSYGDRIPVVFSGHTHRGREHLGQATQAVNIGGDYHFKRLILLDWPGRSMDFRIFGSDNRL